VRCEPCGIDILDDRAEDHARYVHPTIVLCRCGCGETVSQSVHGLPRAWVPGHRAPNVRARAQACRALEELKETIR
jgi:hypothetical protein